MVQTFDTKTVATCLRQPGWRENEKQWSLCRLGGVGDGGDDEAVGSDAIEYGIRSAADNEFTDAGLRAGAAEIGMNSQSFDNGNDARGQAFGGVRLVQGDEGANFLEPGQSQGRPDDL